MDSARLESFLNLTELFLVEYPDSANYYADLVLKTNIDSLHNAKAYYFKGKIAYLECDYAKSLNYIERVFGYWKVIKPIEKADCYNVMGNSYSKMENYKLALSSYFSSLKIRNQLGDKKLISSSLNNIGNVYFQMADYERSLDYYDQSLDLKMDLGDSMGVAVIQNNKGNIYHKIGNGDKALSAYFKALKLTDSSTVIPWKPILLGNIGQLYLDSGDISKAMVYYKRALLEAESGSNKIAIGTVKSSMAKAYLKDNNYNRSLSLSIEALDIAKEMGVPKIELECYYNLFEIYENKKTYVKSIFYLKEYDKLREKVYKENSSREIAEIQTKFQLEQIDREYEILKKNSIIQELEIEKQKNRSILASSFGILFLSLIFYSLYVSRFRKRHNKVLQEKNKIIYQQNSSLTKLNATKDKFLSIVAHDLKNPFNAVLGFTDLLTDRFSELDDSLRKEYIEIIHKSAHHGSLLLDTLLTWSRSQMGAMEYTPLDLNVSQLIEEEMEILEEKAFAKGINLEYPERASILGYCDSDMIRTVLRNLGNNAIKFTEKKGKVVFSIEISDKEIIVSITDNGIGIRPEDKSKLFELDTNFTKPGTSNEKGTGLGLILCKDFVEKNGGKIGVESTLGVGSRFWFTLPFGEKIAQKKSPIKIMEDRKELV